MRDKAALRNPNFAGRLFALEKRAPPSPFHTLNPR
jgi:hypothetical protein